MYKRKVRAQVSLNETSNKSYPNATLKQKTTTTTAVALLLASANTRSHINAQPGRGEVCNDIV